VGLELTEPEINLDWLEKWNLYSPNKVALKDILNEKSYTYSSLFKIANGLVPYLQGLGVQKGSRVAVFAENRIETLVLFFALHRMGAVLVPINFRFTAPEANFVLSDSGSGLLFFDSARVDVVQEIEASLTMISFDDLSQKVLAAESSDAFFKFVADFDEPCQILYTSGTTGFPKGVVITPKILFWNSVNTNLSLQIGPQDCAVSFLPLFHTGGWNVLLTPFLHRGGTTLFLPRFDAEKILELCESERVTILFGVPTTLGMMTRAPQFKKSDLSSLRFAVVGGEPMPLTMIETWHKRGVATRQGFGLTECGPNCFSLEAKDAESKIGSIGRPNFYVKTRIVNEVGADVDIGEVGELLLSGPMCMEKYWNNEEATKNAIQDGWLKTGDLVRRDEQHYYYVVGRKKEMYISGGENVYPVEVEKVLGQHPNVQDVAVLGIQDSKWGEVGKAFIVFEGDDTTSIEDLIDFCQARLARYKVPKHFKFLQEMPKGNTGKILKKELIKDDATEELVTKETVSQKSAAKKDLLKNQLQKELS